MHESGLTRRAALLSPLALGACAVPSFSRLTGSVCPGPAIATVPIATASAPQVGTLWYVPVSFGGRPFAMALDTGCTRVVLTQAGAQALGLRTQAVASTTPAGIATLTGADATVIPQIAFGNQMLADLVVPVIRLPLPDAAGLPVVGILGMSVLSKFDIEVDAAATQLTLYGNADCDVAPAWQGAYAKLTMGVLSTNSDQAAVSAAKAKASGDKTAVPDVLPNVAQITCDMTVNGRALNAVIDTGAPQSLITEAAAARVGLGTGGEPIGLTIGYGQKVNARLRRFADVRAGDTGWSDVPLPIVPGPEKYPGDMLLGRDLLAGGRVWISVGAKTLFLQRN